MAINTLADGTVATIFMELGTEAIYVISLRQPAMRKGQVMTKLNEKEAAEKGFTREDWDAVDAPEATEAELAQALSFNDAMPTLAERFSEEIKRRGRPKLESPKLAVSMRLDADLVKTLKGSGKGWQSRANAMLREAVGLSVIRSPLHTLPR